MTFVMRKFVSLKQENMKSTLVENNMVEAYLALLSGLSNSGKKLLIKRLNASMKVDQKSVYTDFEAAFGAWQGDESAEQLIENIRQTRTENPARATF